MPATLRDVAEYAQVSMRTVSNVVSGYTHVSERMRKHVLQAIDELGYRPNPVARTLRTGRTGMLAFVVPEIDVPYFSALARDVIDAAAEVGYRVMIDQTGHDHDHERDLLTGNDRTMLFDGILFSPLVTKAELLEMNSPTQMPLVLLGEHEFDGRYDHVAIDNVRAAYDAVRHLLDTGRTRVAAIGAQPLEEYATPQQRTVGYELALREVGIEPEQRYARPAAHYSRADGYGAAVELLALDVRPDAIFCFSDLLAMGAMRAVFDAGLSVPQDVAIIGIDNIEEGRFSRPSLSTISLDTSFIAEQAIARVTARIETPDLRPRQIVAPHTLRIRESTASIER
ncbi:MULTISPECIES: LacI family DNA-binding transcriptional regulator [Cryobacterium]|uniref:LacI family transcriptional regulator n=1 Tax=Cryobacterium zongtaii TaxID=1259217 RepID=A0A2S3ZDE5_9MICO|nr:MULTISPECIES: LacI family DNA-binding transcriptional regulator [Cryobacterium]POH64385.1 LacI family transcriptional regulator [Cryobacterium zongtaii]POH67818.1 LacI family transcriptional regulator [Cryobacterium zongtaii]TFC47818.1 LacI family transcriptional regulator [Cryobacterium sp. TMN-39-2]